MKTLAVVPARRGSKGLPGKNARPFLGVPLIQRAIAIAQETCDEVIVTTDDPELARLAHESRAPVRMRPAELATDEAPMLPVVQDAIRGREGDVIVLLQPTQPLRTAEHVRAALRLFESTGADSVASVVAVPGAYSPDRVLHLNMGRLEYATHKPAANRQDAREAYVRDGTVYVFRRAALDYQPDEIDGRPLILPGDALSIDTAEDFERLERIAWAQKWREPIGQAVTYRELGMEDFDA